MIDEPFSEQIGIIYQQIALLHQYKIQFSLQQQEQVAGVLEEISTAVDNLQLIYEEMQTKLEASTVIEEALLEQSTQVLTQFDRYYDLFQFAPDAYLLTDANGLILEANASARKLLNIPQNSLIRKPLVVFVPRIERQAFRSYLIQLSQAEAVQDWEMSLCPRDGKPFTAQLKVAIARDLSGNISTLRIGIRDISQYKQAIAQPLQLLEPQREEVAQDTTPVSSLPRSLDGLQVLIVEDEADAREFIAAVLESHGIRVTAVATTAEALATLERFRPDVLVSDIRMPDENGYSLIRKIRELEAEKGWHIPAAALTAYLAEDREKALAAGFESHLHKLAQPTELVEMVARLAGRV